MRSRAKAVNFGIVYGIGAFLCPRISTFPGKRLSGISTITTLYSGVDRYMKEVVEKAKEDGYVGNPVPPPPPPARLTASISNLRAFGERG